MQYPPASDSWKRSDTKLWAGIASFRDSLCGQTLFNMFSKAAFPERITAGVVQQNEEEDESCMKAYCDHWTKVILRTIVALLGRFLLSSERQWAVRCSFRRKAVIVHLFSCRDTIRGRMWWCAALDGCSMASGSSEPKMHLSCLQLGNHLHRVGRNPFGIGIE